MFMSFSRDTSRFRCKNQEQMFLLISGRHVGDHPDWHQHAVFIQISINMGKTLHFPLFWTLFIERF